MLACKLGFSLSLLQQEFTSEHKEWLYYCQLVHLTLIPCLNMAHNGLDGAIMVHFYVQNEWLVY